DGPQALPVLLAAVVAVEVAVAMDAGGIVIRQRVIGCPKLFCLRAVNLDEDRSGAITRGKKYQVTNNQRRGSIHGSAAAGSPGKFETHFAGCRLDIHQPVACEKERVSCAGNGSRHWRGVPGFVTGCGPDLLSRAGVEGSHPGAIRAANVQEHAAVFDQRRARYSEKAFGRSEFLTGIDAPEPLAARQIEALQDALRAKCVNFVRGNGGRAAGAFVEPEVILVMTRGIRRPDPFSGVSIQALDNFPVFYAMKQNHASTRNHGPAKTFADLHLPYERRPALRPSCREIRAGILAIARRAQKLRPVLTL